MENRESISDIENPSPDDIEAQQTPPRCLEAIIPCLGRGIAAVAIIEVPFFFCSMKMNTVIHFAAVLVLVVGGVTTYVVSKGRVAQNTIMSRGLLLLPTTFIGLAYTLQTYELLFPKNLVLSVVA
eukprot:gene31904-42556_t